MVLDVLEAESIDILREAVACAERPVLLLLIGKDSSVLLHLARKAFYPSQPPFSLLHVDTSWKFKDMYLHRERVARELGMRMLVHRNEEGVAAGVSPFTSGSLHYTNMMKTEALKQDLTHTGRTWMIWRCAPRRGGFALEGAYLLIPFTRSPLGTENTAA